MFPMPISQDLSQDLPVMSMWTTFIVWYNITTKGTNLHTTIYNYFASLVYILQQDFGTNNNLQNTLPPTNKRKKNIGQP